VRSRVPGSRNGFAVVFRLLAARSRLARVRFFPARWRVSTIVQATVMPYQL
jgi:hypothetical protein